MAFLKIAAGVIKYILFFFNLICAIAGIVLAVHGGISLVKTGELRTILNNDHLSDLVPSLVIAFGVFVFLISFIGCCGAMQGNICLLETYSIFMMVLVLLQVMLACFMLLFLDDIQKDTRRSFDRMWRTRGSSKNSRMMVDMIQENLECCGSRNFLDYGLPPQIPIPPSCCKRTVDVCLQQDAHRVGCRDFLWDSIYSSGSMIAYICLGSAVFELFAAILGFCMSGYIRKVNAVRRCCFYSH